MFDESLEDDKERKLAEQARLLYPIIIEFISTKQIMGQIESQGIAKPSQAYKLIQETEKIYGRVRQVTKDGRRSLLVEIIMEALYEAKEAKDYKAVDRLVDKLAKLDGLYEAQGHMTTIYNNLTMAPIQISDEAPKDVIDLEINE